MTIKNILEQLRIAIANKELKRLRVISKLIQTNLGEYKQSFSQQYPNATLAVHDFLLKLSQTDLTVSDLAKIHTLMQQLETSLAKSGSIAVDGTPMASAEAFSEICVEGCNLSSKGEDDFEHINIGDAPVGATSETLTSMGLSNAVEAVVEIGRRFMSLADYGIHLATATKKA